MGAAIHRRKATEEEVNLFAAEGDVAGQARFQLSSFACAEWWDAHYF